MHEFSFHLLSRFNLRQVPIVYRLVGTVLIGIFSIPSLFLIKILALYRMYDTKGN